MQTNYIETFNHIKTPEPIKRHRQILSPYVAPGCKTLPRFKNSRYTAADIKAAVVKCAGITVEQIESSNRNRTFVTARKVLCYTVRNKIDNISLKGIGRLMGGRDHSTVHHSIREAKYHIEANDELFCDMLKSVEDMLSSGF